MEGCVRIEKLANGYTVRMRDPKIVEANNKRDNSKSGSYAPWKDPDVEFAFKDVKEVLTFLGKNLDKALQCADEFSSSFDAAVAEDND